MNCLFVGKDVGGHKLPQGLLEKFFDRHTSFRRDALDRQLGLGGASNESSIVPYRDHRKPTRHGPRESWNFMRMCFDNSSESVSDP